jgi:hypothetical protein
MKVTFDMVYAKDTKGTRVFENEESPVRTLYVSKISPLAKAEKVTVTIDDGKPDA